MNNISKKIALIFAIAYVSANFGMEKEQSGSQFFDTLCNAYQQMATERAHVSAYNRLLELNGHPSREKHQAALNNHLPKLKAAIEKVDNLIKEANQNKLPHDQKNGIIKVMEDLAEAETLLNSIEEQNSNRID